MIFIMVVSCSQKPKEQQLEETESKYEETEMTLLIGTYTRKEGHVDGKADGIYVYTLNPETGELTYKSTSPAVINPSYLTIHPSGNYVYAVEETGGPGEDESGSVAAFAFDKETKMLSMINQVSSGGDWPCYISNESGRNVLVANYGGTSAIFPIFEDGAIGPANSIIQHNGQGPTDRQEGPHAHMLLQDNGGGSEVYGVDLGTDRIFVYELDDSSQTLINNQQEIEITSGAGPRQMAFHPQMKTAYVLNELNGTIEVFDMIDPVDFQRSQIISTLSEANSDEPAGSADIQIHPSGKFLYASNRGEVNDIAIYEVSPTNGQLTLIGHQSSLGKGPRSFVIDPTGTFLLVANQDTSDIFTFRIDRQTGLLNDNPVKTEVPTPVCLKIM